MASEYVQEYTTLRKTTEKSTYDVVAPWHAEKTDHFQNFPATEKAKQISTCVGSSREKGIKYLIILLTVSTILSITLSLITLTVIAASVVLADDTKNVIQEEPIVSPNADNTWQNNEMVLNEILNNNTKLLIETIQESIETIQESIETIQERIETIQERIETIQENVQNNAKQLKETKQIIESNVLENKGLASNILEVVLNVQNGSIPTSCEYIKENQPNNPSGYYHINSDIVYCEMGELCGSKGGWSRLAYLDMSDSTVDCPTGFRLYEKNGNRACGRLASDEGSCASVKFPSKGISYSEVCGRVVGYQYGTPDAVDTRFGGPEIYNDINTYYVDGVSITQSFPRKHIWTLMGGVFESIPDPGNW